MTILQVNSASFFYDGSNKAILEDWTHHFTKGWTGLIGANGCGKSTLLKILAGELELHSGQILGRSANVYYCRQETLDPPIEFTDFQNAHEREAISLRSSLELHKLNARDWAHLSRGEQKRYQLACALWCKPDLFLVDEPTNHLDSQNRKFIIQTLTAYKGIGVLVSHDRELLNAICQHSLFFVEGRIYSFSGAYDSAKKELDARKNHALKQKTILKDKSDSLKEEVQRLDNLIQSSTKKMSKGTLSKKDHDAKSKINLARLTGKDRSFDQKKVNLNNRIDRLQSESEEFKVHKDYSGDIFFEIESKSQIVFHSEVEVIPLPDGSLLKLPGLLVKSGQKVGIVGPNGVGKTTLLNFIQSQIGKKKVYYLQQELSVSDSEVLQKRFRGLNKEECGRCLQIIGRLGSDPIRFMRSESWSSGEMRKIAIALAILDRMEVLILDEPTNHLDLPSITNLESALAKSPLALLLVSHDASFIENVCTEIWRISRTEDGTSLLEYE